MKDLVLDEDLHKYTYRDKPVPGVSEILHTAGYHRGYWTEEARTRGKHIHTATHLLDQGRLDWDTVDLIYQGYVQAYQRFIMEHEPRILESEKMFFYRELRYCGRPDRLVGLAGARGIMDFKTGAPDRRDEIQAVAYAHGKRLAKAWILYLKPNSYYKLVPVKGWVQTLIVWKACVRIYYDKKAGGYL